MKQYGNDESLESRIQTIDQLIDSAAEIVESFSSEVCHAKKAGILNEATVLTILDNFGDILSGIAIINSCLHDVHDDCMKRLYQEVDG